MIFFLESIPPDWYSLEYDGLSVSGKLTKCPTFDVIVLQLSDNISFYSRTCEGGFILCRRETGRSRYHVEGDLVSAAVRGLREAFRRLLLHPQGLWWQQDYRASPLPRHITVGCCTDSNHAPIMALDNFRSTFISGLIELRRTSSSWWSRRPCLQCTVVNPLWLLADPPKLLKAQSTSQRRLVRGWPPLSRPRPLSLQTQGPV